MLLSTMNLIYRFVRIFLPLVMSLSSQVATEKADFDFYVFSMSYQPEFCYAHRPDHYAGCQQPMNYWKTHLTIHGLWPEVGLYYYLMDIAFAAFFYSHVSNFPSCSAAMDRGQRPVPPSPSTRE
jgi:ribonuclease I